MSTKPGHSRTVLDRRSKIPLYLQLYDIVRGEILSGRWKPGELMPSEPEFMEKYQVSRITVRQVFDMLTHEGMVQRERGRGTFVTQPDIVGGGGYVYDFAYEMYQRNLTPSTRMISSHLAPVARETAVHLDIAIGDELVCIERLRLADGEPISVEESYLVHSRCPGLLDGHDFANESLREVLLNQYGLRLTRARQVVRAMAASLKLAGLLSVPEHFPLLFVERYTYTDDNRPLEYMRIYYRSDRFEMQSELPFFQAT